MEYSFILENVTKEYTDFKLNKINLALPTGTIMGFIGENGAGKSTTIKAILDLVHCQEGKITLLGKDRKEDRVLTKEKIGVVLDDICFSENFRVKDINCIMKNVYHTWDEKKYFEFINRLRIPENKKIKEYSKGMKMKLSIAVALSHQSKLLILDEATSGLDPVVRNDILDLLQEFVMDETNSVLISSHIVSDLEKICDYITFIHNGEIILSDEKDSMLQKYAILKCSKKEWEKGNKDGVISYRENQFGIEALVEKNKVKENLVIDSVTLEDIMLFIIKGERI